MNEQLSLVFDSAVEFDGPVQFEGPALEAIAEGLDLLHEWACGGSSPSMARSRLIRMGTKGQVNSAGEQERREHEVEAELCSELNDVKGKLAERESRVKSLEATIRVQHQALQALVMRMEALVPAQNQNRPKTIPMQPATQAVRRASGG